MRADSDISGVKTEGEFLFRENTISGGGIGVGGGGEEAKDQTLGFFLHLSPIILQILLGNLWTNLGLLFNPWEGFFPLVLADPLVCKKKRGQTCPTFFNLTLLKLQSERLILRALFELNPHILLIYLFVPLKCTVLLPGPHCNVLSVEKMWFCSLSTQRYQFRNEVCAVDFPGL